MKALESLNGATTGQLSKDYGNKTSDKHDAMEPTCNHKCV